MSMLLNIVWFSVFFLCRVTDADDESYCTDKQSCGACLQEVDCIWCSNPFNAPSSLPGVCKNKHNVLPDWCPYDDLDDPTTNIVTVIDDDLQSATDKPAIQLKPQRLRLQLRKGEETQFNFQYAQASNYPIDLYYVMDSSNTMRQHKNKLSELAHKLVEVMKNVTTDFRLGFGSFVDKTEMPFTNTHPKKFENPCSGYSTCAKGHSFINHLSLTTDYAAFSTEVINAEDSGNIDDPEGGLDALMQVMVCRNEIGWRENARHVIVYSTDSLFHVAGDGRLAGVVEPNDGKCHLKDNDYMEAALIYDYPSVSFLNHVAKENNMNVIFAIAAQNDVFKAYEELQDFIENSNVGELKPGSTNVIELILENYKKIVSGISITDNSSSTIEILYQANCSSPTENGCDDLHTGDIVDFTATIKALECREGHNKQTIQIKPEGVNEALIIEAEVLCNCDCEKPDHHNYIPWSPECSNNGNLSCGVCSCGAGYFGKNCECDSSKLSDKDNASCIKSNDTRACSDRGDCVCGQCVCHEKMKDHVFTGTYCECDDYSCKRHNSLMCGGENRGRCECGTCKCLAGWTGDACECPVNNKMCISPHGDGAVCSGHGDCVCGECKCKTDEQSYSGKYCEECFSCSGQRCEELFPCVECQCFKSGIYNETQCSHNCTAFITKMVDEIDEKTTNKHGDVKTCRILDDSGCTIVFQYSYDENKQLVVKALKEKSCPETQQVNAVVIAVIASIVLGGLILLAIWKVFTTVHDRREYAKFENERQNMKWNSDINPLFKSPNTMVLNPRYGYNFD